MNSISRDTLPAIIIVAFNRPKALERLLKSVEAAKYDFFGIPLIISIDGGGSKEVEDVANSFDWKYGQKEIITHSTNLGLREHVLQCGDFTEKYGSIIMLEEDCFVSPNYYNYTVEALNFYKDDNNVGGISLYSYSINENAFLPFYPFKDGYDVFFMQVPSSLGQAWHGYQWKGFKEYYNQGADISEFDNLPENVKAWPESSWKKYFYKYLVETNKFFVFPHISLTTNFGDVGTHLNKLTETYQVLMDFRTGGYKFIQFGKSKNKYDGYFEILPECIGLNNNTIIDLYGTKQLELFGAEFAYSIKICIRPMIQYGACLKPNFLNITYKIRGVDITYGRKGDFRIVSPETEIINFKRVSEFVFASGARVGETIGYERGKNFILNSLPYRVGNALLYPFKAIKKIIKPD